MHKSAGRIKRKLLTILNDAGLQIPDVSCFWTQEGTYRSRYWDLARWGAQWKLKPNGIYETCCSCDTMTDCVRFGVEIDDEGEVAAKMTSKDKSEPERRKDREKKKQEEFRKKDEAAKRRRFETRRERFRVYRCSRCQFQFPWNKGEKIECWRCNQQDCLTDVSDDVLP